MGRLMFADAMVHVAAGCHPTPLTILSILRRRRRTRGSAEKKEHGGFGGLAPHEVGAPYPQRNSTSSPVVKSSLGTAAWGVPPKPPGVSQRNP